MKKILVLVVVLAVIWAVPALRQKIGIAMLPLLEHLGPVGDRLATPVRNFKAKGQATFYLRIMRDDATEGREMPNPRTFLQWTERRLPREAGPDPWGNPYWMTQQGRTVTIGSNGADGKRDTSDDITDSATF